MSSFKSYGKGHRKLVLSLALLLAQQAQAQNVVPLTDLSYFQNPSANWKLASGVQADLYKDHVITMKDGTGVLVNNPAGSGAADLYTRESFGDADVTLEYMMAKGSNSGIYLQGRYEVQLLDSWGKTNPGAGDNGGIYQRWDDSKPAGSQGYDGHPPRLNASRAPGLWQQMRISFQAPRFDEKGNKTANARFLQVWLNGVLVQENVELTGPTRGAMQNNEVAEGPLRIQGDHGAVAFRKISVVGYDKPRSYLSNLKYKLYNGASTDPKMATAKPAGSGDAALLTSSYTGFNNDFLLTYTGDISITKPGEYRFNLRAPGGTGSLEIDGKEVIKKGDRNGNGTIQLEPGTRTFNLSYAKTADWAKPALALTIAGPGIRENLLSDANVSNNDPVDPILIDATSNTIVRSFTDIPGGIRITHGINVGSPEQVHYTYDLDRGMIVQVWRGGFLNATPMWHERGDGSSRPAGSVQYFGKPSPAIQKLADPQAAWSADTAGTGFRPKGYVLNASVAPAFKYITYGARVQDSISVLPGGQGLSRKITLQSPVDGAYFLLAGGSTIEAMGDGLYAVDDKSYYIKLDNGGSEKPLLRDKDGRQELIIPVKQQLTYSIIF